MADLLRFYHRLPARTPEEDVAVWSARLKPALQEFGLQVQSRYMEGTLQRLLQAGPVEVRQAAVLALGRLGTIASNRPLAKKLRDVNPTVRELAGDAMWSVWFRADTPANNHELQRLRRRSDRQGTDLGSLLDEFAALLDSAPRFAEAHNQRAILYFRLGEWESAIGDCIHVLKLNTYHFGAASGMAQCYLKLRKFRLALRAYRRAYHINPNLSGLQPVIRSLEQMLGEEGKR